MSPSSPPANSCCLIGFNWSLKGKNGENRRRAPPSRPGGGHHHPHRCLQLARNKSSPNSEGGVRNRSTRGLWVNRNLASHPAPNVSATILSVFVGLRSDRPSSETSGSRRVQRREKARRDGGSIHHVHARRFCRRDAAMSLAPVRRR